MTSLKQAALSSVAQFFRTEPAAAYLKQTYGEGSATYLTKLRNIGGGPCYRKLGARTVVYEKTALDEWAMSRLSSEISSTSETHNHQKGRGHGKRKVATVDACATA